MVKDMSKKSFIRSGEGAIASYNWQDIASGTGYTTYYASTLIGGNSLTNVQEVTHKDAYKTLNGNDTESFSFTVNKPMTIKGQILFQVANQMTGGSASQLKAGLYYNSGSGDVLIGESSNGTTVGLTNIYLGYTATATETILKKGDTLKLVITSTGSGQCYLFAQPSGSTVVSPIGDCDKTITKVCIPQKIDI